MAAPRDIITQYLKPGHVLKNRYQIEKIIGSGAYSAIFSAIDSKTGQRVAVKAMPPISEGGRKTSIGRFQREMKIIGNLRHENIISLYDFGKTEERIGFMIIEFIQGRTLMDVIDQNPMPLRTAIDVTRQIASALQIAHQRGVIHRDLKPQNVMLIRKDTHHYIVKVLDFGMAKLTSSNGEIAELTREGIAVGTPRYIAPEQARGKKVGPYSDLYALGLLMYEMFTGERAVKADSIESAIRAHVSSKPHVFENIERIPPAMQDILYKLTAKPVSERYQDAALVIRDLNKVEKSFFSTSQNSGLPLEDEPTVAYNTKQRKARDKKLKNDTRQSKRKNTLPATSMRERKAVKTETQGFSLFFLLISVPISFLTISAHFTGTGFLPRLFIALSPLLLALLPSIVAVFTKKNPSIPFTRLALGFSITAILGAHLFSPNTLGSGLWRDANWFLLPFNSVPGVEELGDIIQRIARAYISVLSSLFHSFSPR